MSRLWIAFFSLALAACGGNARAPIFISLANYDVAAEDQGTPSHYNNAVIALRDFYVDNSTALSESELVLLRGSTAANFLNNIGTDKMVAARDTGAPQAWQQGWSGKGVKVGHLDDFVTSAQGQTHGELVQFVTRQIAPEATYLTQQLTLTCTANNQDEEIRRGFAHFESTGYHIVSNSWGTPRWRSGACGGTPGLATQAVWDSWVATESRDRVTRAMIFTDTPESYDKNMLFIFAAGNDGLTCPGGVADCALRAAALVKIRADEDAGAGARIILVGALESHSNSLASYSNSAGALKNDFITAHHGVLTANDARGTSFAAPRVAGAAALVRHKFPNLDGAALKQVLLRTAEDLGAEGVDDVFGHGKLDIMGALSPIGKLRVQR